MPTSPLPGFVALNAATSFYRPEASNGHSEPHPAPPPHSGPSLIVFCAWMGAAPKHIAKYTDGYRRLFPHAEMLLIESSLAAVALGADLSAAVDYLGPYAKEALAGAAGRRRVLLSLSSNGGAMNSTALASLLQEKYGAVPFDAVIFDCCPSRGSIDAATRAIVLGFPKQPVVQFIGWYTVYAMISTYAAVVYSLGIEDVAARFLRVLNDPDVFSTKAPRLYMYSRADALVKFADIHRHADGARLVGYGVREEVFLTAPHCALLNEDSSRYWDAVRTHALDGTTDSD